MPYRAALASLQVDAVAVFLVPQHPATVRQLLTFVSAMIVAALRVHQYHVAFTAGCTAITGHCSYWGCLKCRRHSQSQINLARLVTMFRFQPLRPYIEYLFTTTLLASRYPFCVTYWVWSVAELCPLTLPATLWHVAVSHGRHPGRLTMHQ